jgi:formylglycine-generating enzyme required for sulfatase activity
MSSLADLSELVGFFSYSREDDQDSEGALSALRARIQRELRSQLGRSLRLWQDQEAIAPGKLWESEITAAIEQSMFFIPIITPRIVNSEYCRFEFESFLAREKKLGRADLVFPILYIRVRALEDDALWRNDPVLSIIGRRQYVDWRTFRHVPVTETGVRVAIEHFCGKIIEALTAPISPAAQPAAKEQAPPAVALQPEPQPEASPRIGESFRDGPDFPEMVVLPAGEFLMGSPEGEQGRGPYEGPQHRVRIARPFAIARYPLTFAEYDRFCAATGRSEPDDQGWGKGLRPVINVSWEDAQAYIAWLSRATGRNYRLPAEAEWEYACRAGTTTRYSFGDRITPKDTNWEQAEVSRTSEVGTYPPNPWGLYDMHGNVWEWVEDNWHDNYEGAPANGSAWKDAGAGPNRPLCVLRGGSWDGGAGVCRSACRYWIIIGNRRHHVGFRVARTL